MTGADFKRRGIDRVCRGKGDNGTGRTKWCRVGGQHREVGVA